MRPVDAELLEIVAGILSAEPLPLSVVADRLALRCWAQYVPGARWVGLERVIAEQALAQLKREGRARSEMRERSMAEHWAADRPVAPS